MPEKAIEKLQSEMTQNKANSNIQVIGGFLLDHLGKNPQDADKILDADKTIGKSHEVMRQAAKKKQVKGEAAFTPQEGFNIVMKYFGIDVGAPSLSVAIEPKLAPAGPKPTTSDFNVNLDDLL